MLFIPQLKTCPQLSKGKGAMESSTSLLRKRKEREEFVSHLIAIPENATLTIYAGKRKLGLKPSDLENFRGERGRRGGLLP